MPKSNWQSDWKVGLRVWVERAGKVVLGEGRAELLAAIEREHSITKAAKAVGMSYRRAWTMIQEVNEAAGQTLAEAAVGGKKGGGARLTPNGRLAIEVFEQVRESLVGAAGGALRKTVVGPAANNRYVHIAAAISLQEAMGQILAEYALVEPTVRARAVYGASNELADHLLAGAPGDLFLSAEPAELDRLEAAKILVAASRQFVAKNGLTIVGSEKAGRIKKAADLLDTRFRHVALAEPACPLGQYSKTYLQKVRMFDTLAPKVVSVDNSRAVLAAVAAGAAEAGIAFSSDAASRGAWKILFSIPSSQAAATYAAAIVRSGQMQKPAQSLLDFVTSAAGARCLRRCGLVPFSAVHAASRQSTSLPRSGSSPS